MQGVYMPTWNKACCHTPMSIIRTSITHKPQEIGFPFIWLEHYAHIWAISANTGECTYILILCEVLLRSKVIYRDSYL